ncbi:MAG: NAD-dependent epimerase/dehydratase family protein, partial [Planctomycetota bacterium]
MKVLVMGGTRFNGRHLVFELVRQGHEVTIFNRGQTQAKIPPEVRRLFGNRKDHQLLREVLSREEFDCVVDMSAYTVDDVVSIVDILEGRTGHYIFVSTGNVYAPSENYPITEAFPLDESPAAGEYAANKAKCEHYLGREYRRRRFPHSIARLSLVYGPYNHFLYREQMMFVRLLKGRRILVPGRGETLTHPGYVTDGAHALISMMGNSKTFGEAYNVTGPHAVTDNSYVDTLAKIVGVEVQKLYLPAEAMDLWMTSERPPLIARIGRRNLRWSANIVYGVQKLRDHLGFYTQYTLELGMRQTFEWFEKEGLADKLSFDFSVEDEFIDRYCRPKSV